MKDDQREAILTLFGDDGLEVIKAWCHVIKKVDDDLSWIEEVLFDNIRLVTE